MSAEAKGNIGEATMLHVVALELGTTFPQPGLMPIRGPRVPTTSEQSDFMERAATGQILMGEIPEEIVHSTLNYYTAPDFANWRCAGCYAQILDGWVPHVLHNVGLRVLSGQPTCPGCGQDKTIIRPAEQCFECLMVFLGHKEELGIGMVYQAGHFK